MRNFPKISIGHQFIPMRGGCAGIIPAIVVGGAIIAALSKSYCKQLHRVELERDDLLVAFLRSQAQLENTNSLLAITDKALGEAENEITEYRDLSIDLSLRIAELEGASTVKREDVAEGMLMAGLDWVGRASRAQWN